MRKTRQDLLSLYRRRRVPSDILKHILEQNTEATVPDLLAVMRHAFDLPDEDVQCIRGCWHDRSGELSDHELDALLVLAIERARGAPDGE